MGNEEGDSIDKGGLETKECINVGDAVETHVCSAVEEKIRDSVDRILEQNLNFWLRFSTSYHQMQKFQGTYSSLHDDAEKILEAKTQEGTSSSSSTNPSSKQEAAIVEKNLRELNTDLQVWLEKNEILKEEIESRFSLLSSIEEEILKGSEAADIQLTSYQAAKFQGEVLNLRQENKKVMKELEAGLEAVKGIQVEVGRSLLKLRESFQLGGSRSSDRSLILFKSLSSKKIIPLRTFLFGKKSRKRAISMFSCMNPALQRQYSDLRGGR